MNIVETVLGLFKSKTFYAALAMASATLFPAVDAWVSSHPGKAATVVSIVMIVLRAMTKEPLAAKVAPTA